MYVAPTSDWKLMGYDEGSTYFNRAEVKLTKDNVGTLEMAWQAILGGPLYGAPLQVGDKRRSCGRKVASLRGTLAGVITIANGHVAFGDGLEWVNAKDGNTLTVLRLPRAPRAARSVSMPGLGVVDCAAQSGRQGLLVPCRIM